MFEIGFGSQGELIVAGRFDASRAEYANAVLDSIIAPVVVDLGRLEYISSMGLGLLIKTQKRLVDSAGSGLKLVNVSPHILDIFNFSGFHHIFEIEPASE